MSFNDDMNINEELTPSEKRREYEKDILYTTNNELGFDYLRDNMATSTEQKVQRPKTLLHCIDFVPLRFFRENPIVLIPGRESLFQYLNSFDRKENLPNTRKILPDLLL